MPSVAAGFAVFAVVEAAVEAADVAVVLTAPVAAWPGSAAVVAG